MRTFLHTCLFALFCVGLSAQSGYTKRFANDPVGESDSKIVAYRGGFLKTSQLYSGTGNLLKKVNSADSMVASLVFDNAFKFQFSPVPTTNGNIFVFGTDTFAGFNEVHFVILDSNLNPLIQKKIPLNFVGIRVRFFKAVDGGVIGEIQENCAYDRIFRLDAYGNVMWVKTYTSDAYNNVMTPVYVTSINLFGGNRYMMSGANGFGQGFWFATIDDDGNLLGSVSVQSPLTGYWSNGIYATAFDGEKLCVLNENIYDTPDSTYIVIADTGLNILMMRRIMTNTNHIVPLTIVSTPQEFIVALTQNYAAPGSSVLLTAFDKTTLTNTWSQNTWCDGTADTYFLSLDGIGDGNGNATFVYNYGPYTSGIGFSEFGLTKLDPVTHAGFCDAISVVTSCPAIPFTPFYPAMDTFHILPDFPTVAAYVIGVGVLTGSQTACTITATPEQLHGEINVLYPNPTSGSCYLGRNFYITITDIAGNEVVCSYSNVIDLSLQPPGIYLATLRDEEGKVRHEKIIRE